MEKRRNCSFGAISPLFRNIFYLLLDFHVYAGTRFSLRDKRLFEISDFEIARVNCSLLRIQTVYPGESAHFLPLYHLVTVKISTHLMYTIKLVESFILPKDWAVMTNMTSTLTLAKSN